MVRLGIASGILLALAVAAGVGVLKGIDGARDLLPLVGFGLGALLARGDA